MIKSRDLTRDNSISFQGGIKEKKEKLNLPFQKDGVNQPTNHTNDCYFCTVDPSKRRAGKNAPAIIVYPSIPFSIALVPHSN